MINFHSLNQRVEQKKTNQFPIQTFDVDGGTPLCRAIVFPFSAIRIHSSVLPAIAGNTDLSKNVPTGSEQPSCP